MHGQNRSEYKSRLLDPAVSAKLSAKALHWNALSRELLVSRDRLFRRGCGGVGVVQEPPTSPAVPPSPSPSPSVLLALTDKMLTVNPEPAYLWNARRELLLLPLPTEVKEEEGEVKEEGATEGATAAPFESVHTNKNTVPSSCHSCRFNLESELSLTEQCLRRNPKSYASWHHRKWSLARHLSSDRETNSIGGDLRGESDAAVVSLRTELGLCAQFLSKDERNFHCWNYRRFAASLLGRRLLENEGASDGGGEEVDELADEVDVADARPLDGSWTPLLREWMAGSTDAASLETFGAQLAPRKGSHGGIAKIHHPREPRRSSSPSPLERLLKDEWDFVSEKIRDNFSNGSAFHYRSKLLPLVLRSRILADADADAEPTTANDDGGDGDGDGDRRSRAALDLAREEWEDVLLDAVYTEPDDQTPWWYHRFVVEWAGPPQNARRPLRGEFEALLSDMADSLRELIELELEGENDDDDTQNVHGGGGGAEEGHGDESKGAKCKWAHLGLHFVLSSWIESKHDGDNHRVEGMGGNDEDGEDDSPSEDELREEANGCLRELMRIDPDRTGRYLSLQVSSTAA